MSITLSFLMFLWCHCCGSDDKRSFFAPFFPQPISQTTFLSPLVTASPSPGSIISTPYQSLPSGALFTLYRLDTVESRPNIFIEVKYGYCHPKSNKQGPTRPMMRLLATFSFFIFLTTFFIFSLSSSFLPPRCSFLPVPRPSFLLIPLFSTSRTV